MHNKRGITVLILLLTLLIGGCANSNFYHETFMSGVVAEVNDKEALVCISGRVDLKPGTVLDVYKLDQSSVAVIHDNWGYQRKLTGQVKVTEIVDEHFAKVTLVKGRVRKHDMIESPEKDW